MGLLGAIEGDIYGARAVARILSEHWVRLMALVSAVKNSGDYEAGNHYWSKLRRAEEVVLDRQAREWFPSGTHSDDPPDSVRRRISAMVLDPQPDANDYKMARETIGDHGFKKQVKNLLGQLQGQAPADRVAFGSLALTYPWLSGCIHGGPDAHSWLMRNDAGSRLSAAIDIAVVWTSVLIFVRTHLAGGNRTAQTVLNARQLQMEIAAWFAMVENQTGGLLPG